MNQRYQVIRLVRANCSRNSLKAVIYLMRTVDIPPSAICILSAAEIIKTMADQGREILSDHADMLARLETGAQTLLELSEDIKAIPGLRPSHNKARKIDSVLRGTIKQYPLLALIHAGNENRGYMLTVMRFHVFMSCNRSHPNRQMTDNYRQRLSEAVRQFSDSTRTEHGEVIAQCGDTSMTASELVDELDRVIKIFSKKGDNYDKPLQDLTRIRNAVATNGHNSRPHDAVTDPPPTPPTGQGGGITPGEFDRLPTSISSAQGTSQGRLNYVWTVTKYYPGDRRHMDDIPEAQLGRTQIKTGRKTTRLPTEPTPKKPKQQRQAEYANKDLVTKPDIAGLTDVYRLLQYHWATLTASMNREHQRFALLDIGCLLSGRSQNQVAKTRLQTKANGKLSPGESAIVANGRWCRLYLAPFTQRDKKFVLSTLGDGLIVIRLPDCLIPVVQALASFSSVLVPDSQTRRTRKRRKDYLKKYYRQAARLFNHARLHDFIFIYCSNRRADKAALYALTGNDHFVASQPYYAMPVLKETVNTILQLFERMHRHLDLPSLTPANNLTESKPIQVARKKAPQTHDVRRAFSKLEQLYDDYTEAGDPRRVNNITNMMGCLATNLASGARLFHQAYACQQVFDLTNGYVAVSEKDGDYFTNSRYVPLAPPLVPELAKLFSDNNEYIQQFRLLAARNGYNTDPAYPMGQDRDQFYQQADALTPAFIFTDKDYWTRPLRPSDIRQHCGNLGYDLYRLRAFTRQYYIDHGCPPWIVDYLLGHFLMGQQASNPYAALTWSMITKAVLPIQAKLLNELLNWGAPS